MPSLITAAHRGETQLRTDSDMDFYGTIFAVDEGSVPSYDFTSPRLLLRVGAESIIGAGHMIFDSFGRRFLLADYGAEAGTYKVFRLFHMTHQVSWKRTRVTVDPLTSLPKSASQKPTDLGDIWCAIEFLPRENIDLTLRIKEQTRRVISGADLQLNDLLDDMIVKRLDNQLGVKFAEIQ